MDRRRPRVGPRVPVGRAGRRRTRSSRCGRTTAPASARRSSTSSRWSASVASATRRCTSTTTPPTRRPRCCGWRAATASARTRSTTCCATACSSTFIPLVRKSIRVGTENYSLKSLEPLYMGTELRSGEVTTADGLDHHVRALLRAARRRPGSTRPPTCSRRSRTTTATTAARHASLRDWLIKIAIESGVPPLGPQPVADGTAVEDTDDLARTLMAVRRRRRRGAQPPSRRPSRCSRRRVDIHRREDKPFWWAHFDRLNNPVDEWGDTSDVFLADDVREVVKDWHLPSSRARKQQRWVKLTGTLAAGGLDSNVFALYDPPSPAGLSRRPGPARRGQRRDHRRRRPGRPDRSDHLRAGAQGRRDVSRSCRSR